MEGKTAIPPNGIDLRAELAELVRARVAQARAASKGDDERAATLLRVEPGDLARLEGEVDPRRRARPAACAVSLVAIKRLAAEGLDVGSIGRRLGCNRHLVERALRVAEGRDIERLDREGISPKQIAEQLQIPLQRVRIALINADMKRRRAGAK